MNIAWVVVDEFFEVETGVRYRRGTVLEPGVELERLRSIGIVVLPVDSYLAETALSGARRWDWGGGWNWIGNGAFGCPMVMHVPAADGFLYVVSSFRSRGTPSGYLRLVAQTGRADGTLSAGISPDSEVVELGRLKSPLVGGRYRISTAIDGFLALSLQGTANGIVVDWTAVSRCSERV